MGLVDRRPDSGAAMETLGRHLIVELYGCDPAGLDDVGRVRGAVVAACDAIGATALQVVAHRFAPQGVTVTVLIAESHLSVHTWPEHGYAAVDFFTCGGLDPRRGVPALQQGLGATRGRVHEVVRGLEAHVARAARLLPDDVTFVSSVEALEFSASGHVK